MEDLKYKILLEVDFDTLQHLCLLDKSYHELCQSSRLWKDRIELEFGLDYIEHKPVQMTWSEYYEILYLYSLVYHKIPILSIFHWTYNNIVKELFYYSVNTHNNDNVHYILEKGWTDKLSPKEKEKMLDIGLRSAVINKNPTIGKYLISLGAQPVYVASFQQIELNKWFQ